MSSRPHIAEIPYLDPFAAFGPFADEPWAMFLDSAQVCERQGRHSYIALDPWRTITAQGRRLAVDGETREGDPFALLQAELTAIRAETVPDLVPFQTGALGYFGYELGHHLERLPRAPVGEFAFPDMAVGLYDTVVAFDNLARRAWIVSSGQPESGSAGAERARARSDAFEARLRGASGDPLPMGPRPEHWPAPNWRADCERAEYETKVARVVEHIRAGDIYQANLSRGLRASLPPKLHPFHLYGRLRAINPAPFAAYLGLGEIVIASSSPERFLKLSDGWVETRPIKGTRPRGATPEKDRDEAQALLSSEKDRAENVMIVDLLRNDLSRVCRPHTVDVRELCVLESFATVHHLTSTVTGQLDAGRDAVDLLRASFPGDRSRGRRRSGRWRSSPRLKARRAVRILAPSAFSAPTARPISTLQSAPSRFARAGPVFGSAAASLPIPTRQPNSTRPSSRPRRCYAPRARWRRLRDPGRR